MVVAMSALYAEPLRALLDQIQTIIVGKGPAVTEAVSCLLAGGHLLIEDVPGVGKTTLAQTLARSLGLDFARVQFTPDLMPSDLLGVSIYERASETFRFHPGPVFTQVLLADEINRSGPRTQSALLEAMEERQVTADRISRPLPQPFFVIATQNPQDQAGTFALPESQLDRFLLRLSLGYPDRRAERALLQGGDRRQALAALPAVLSPTQLQALQDAVPQIQVADPLLDYLQDLVDATRSGRWFTQGLSPRGAQAVLRVAQARALMAGRDFVVPEDVQTVLPGTLSHRLRPVPGAGRGAREQVQALINATPLP